MQRMEIFDGKISYKNCSETASLFIQDYFMEQWYASHRERESAFKLDTGYLLIDRIGKVTNIGFLTKYSTY